MEDNAEKDCSSSPLNSSDDFDVDMSEYFKEEYSDELMNKQLVDTVFPRASKISPRDLPLGNIALEPSDASRKYDSQLRCEDPHGHPVHSPREDREPSTSPRTTGIQAVVIQGSQVSGHAKVVGEASSTFADLRNVPQNEFGLKVTALALDKDKGCAEKSGTPVGAVGTNQTKLTGSAHVRTKTDATGVRISYAAPQQATVSALTQDNDIETTFYRIGVDVGGTHTDAVLLNHDEVIGDPIKLINSADTAEDIICVIKQLFEDPDVKQAGVQPAEVQYVCMGTTRFMNALVNYDEALDKVLTVRIGAPCADAVDPYEDWYLTDTFWEPQRLRDAIDGGSFIVEGGYEITGSVIIRLDEKELIRIAEMTLADGDLQDIKVVAISGMNSTKYSHQEERAKEVMLEVNPNLKFTLSHKIRSE